MELSVADPLVGRVLDGRYVLRSRIAKGGMASVYLALDERLDRDVAVKVMQADLGDDEDFVRRFSREARSAARLNHPGIVQVFDQGLHDGVAFLAMEYVAGRTLRDLVRERAPMSPREALDLLEPVLDALAAAHRAGIVHRDVKPENVLIADDGRVKVADFGLARAVDAGSAHSQHGVLIGTVAYLAPEQVERGIADPRSDVYSAGVVLFEMLTGTKPFAGDGPVQIALQHVANRVPAPSSRVDGLPRELDDLVLLATDRDPDARPADARDLLLTLRETRRRLPSAALDARPVIGDDDPQPAMADDPAQRHDRTMALDAAALDAAALDARQASAPVSGARRRSRGRLALVLVLVLAGLLGGAGWWLGAGPGAYQQVPTVVGLSQGAAQSAVTRQGLRFSVHEVYDEVVPVGDVAVADPTDGDRIRNGSTVRLGVSRGPERHPMPTVSGLPEDAAARALTTAHLRVGTVTRKYHDRVADGVVISAGQQVGVQLPRNAAVDLVVSRGRPPVPVASWVGKPASAATRALQGSGLQVSVQEKYDARIPTGAVISQQPDHGTLYQNDTVTLVVSLGPPLVAVPSVVGKQAGPAAKELRALGFKVRVNKVLGGYFGSVRSQNPSAGSMAQPGSTIILTVV